MGVQRPLRAGILFRALLNGMVDVRPSKQQQNGRTTYNVCSTSCNTIPKWLHSRKPGKYFKGLLYPAWSGKLGFTPAGCTLTTIRMNQFSVSWWQEGFISLNSESMSAAVTHQSLHLHESQSLWLICWTIRWIMSKIGFNFPPWAVEDIKISGSFDRSQPCSCLHLIECSLSFSPMTSFWNYKFLWEKGDQELFNDQELSSSMP